MAYVVEVKRRFSGEVGVYPERQIKSDCTEKKRKSIPEKGNRLWLWTRGKT